jgi:hypothetical protein
MKNRKAAHYNFALYLSQQAHIMKGGTLPGSAYWREMAEKKLTKYQVDLPSCNHGYNITQKAILD